jgi:hypothetical protein
MDRAYDYGTDYLKDMYLIEEFFRNGRAFPQTREWGDVSFIRCPQSQDVDLRGGVCLKQL